VKSSIPDREITSWGKIHAEIAIQQQLHDCFWELSLFAVFSLKKLIDK